MADEVQASITFDTSIQQPVVKNNINKRVPAAYVYKLTNLLNGHFASQVSLCKVDGMYAFSYEYNRRLSQPCRTFLNRSGENFIKEQTAKYRIEINSDNTLIQLNNEIKKISQRYEQFLFRLINSSKMNNHLSYMFTRLEEQVSNKDCIYNVIGQQMNNFYNELDKSRDLIRSTCMSYNGELHQCIFAITQLDIPIKNKKQQALLHLERIKNNFTQFIIDRIQVLKVAHEKININKYTEYKKEINSQTINDFIFI